MTIINKKVIEIQRPDYCIQCNTKKSIECYSIYNKPIHYSNLLDRLNRNESIDSILDNAQLSHMICRKCGKTYDISWSIDNHIPIPLTTDIFYNYFMDNYKKIK